MSKRKILAFVFAFTSIMSIGLAATFVSIPVYADAKDDIMKKTLLNAARYCMKNQFTKGVISSADLSSSSGNIDVLIEEKGKNNTIYLPRDYGNKVDGSAISCQEVFNGSTSLTGKVKFTGVLSLYGKQINTSTITSMGYKAEDDGLKEKCLQARYTTSANRDYQTTNKICFTVDNKNNVVINEEHPANIGSEPKDPGLYLRYEGGTVNLYLLQKLDGSGNIRRIAPSGLDVNVANGTSWDDVKNIGDIGAAYDTPLDLVTDERIDYTEFIKEDASSSSAVTQYVKIDELYSGNQTVSFLTDGAIKTLSPLQFTDKEKYDVYMSYVNKLRSDGKISIVGNESCTSKKPDSGWAIWDGEKWCEVKNITDDYLGEKYTMVKDGTPAYPGFVGNKSFGDVMAALMSLNYKDPSFSGTDFGIDASGNIDTGDSDEDGENVSSVCNNVTGLSWIICPVIQLLSDAIEGMYNWIEGNFLEIGAANLSTNSAAGNTAIFDGWRQFQGFANIIFVIMLIIVILSQITGFGISNYGIKKALPKLVVVAVLVNLSFLFCQLAVDLSNILGYTLRNMFESMAGKISNDGAFHLPNVVKDGLGVLELVAVGGVLAAATEFWKKWLPTLLLTLVGVLIGVLFFLITLGVRQAGVLILVVISPVAIICYALPNTKKLFDRWKSMFTSLLLVFPICGALMGGGQLAATIISSSGKALGSIVGSVVASIPGVHFAVASSGFTSSTITDMVAMAIQVAPFFMVPSLVRSSLNGIGNIGNRLAQAGSRWGNKASNALGKTDAMQDFQRRMEMSRDKGLLERMNRKVEGKSRIGIGRHRLSRTPRELSQSEKRKYAQLSKRRQSMLTEDATAALGVGKSYLEGSEEYETLVNRIRNEQMEKEVKAQRYNINDSDISDNVTALRGALDEHLADLKLNPDDDSNKAKVYAHLDQLTTQGDAGMTQVGQAIQAAIANNDLAGAQAMSRYILKNYGKQYKDKQRGTFDMAGDLSRLDLNNSTQVQEFKNKADLNSVARTRKVIKPDGTTETETYAFYTSEYDKHGIDSLDAQRIGDINEDSLTRLHELAMTGQLNAQQMASLSRISARALANDANGTGHVQDKLRGKLTDLSNIGVGQGNAFASAIQASADIRNDDATRREALGRAQRIATAMSGSSDGWRRLSSQVTQMGSSGDTNVQASLSDVMQNVTSDANNMSQAVPIQIQLANDVAAGNFANLESSTIQEVASGNEGETEYSSDYYENHTTAFQSSTGTTSNPNLVDGNSDFGSMDLPQLQRMARQATYSWGATTNPDGTVSHGAFKNGTAFANQFDYNNIAQGITQALKTDARFRDPENAAKVKELNKFLAAGGFKTINPNTVRELKPLPKIPDGWDATGRFSVTENGVTRTQANDLERKKYEQWLDEMVTVQRYNEEVQKNINEESNTH